MAMGRSTPIVIEGGVGDPVPAGPRAGETARTSSKGGRSSVDKGRLRQASGGQPVADSRVDDVHSPLKLGVTDDEGGGALEHVGGSAHVAADGPQLQAR